MHHSAWSTNHIQKSNRVVLQATDFTSQFGAQPTHFPSLRCIGVFVCRCAGSSQLKATKCKMQCSLSAEVWFFQGPRENENETGSLCPDFGLHIWKWSIKASKDSRFIWTESELGSEDTSKGVVLHILWLWPFGEGPLGFLLLWWIDLSFPQCLERGQEPSLPLAASCCARLSGLDKLCPETACTWTDYGLRISRAG